MPRERHPGHRIPVGHSDDDPTRASYHPSELGERTIQLSDEVDGIDGSDSDAVDRLAQALSDLINEAF